ncbi:MAG: 50S ribosomal protein L17 [Deltaproteobacteria bacterium]|nr:50S ribosomal protein L17 [Deltaproteobacteria bacterium]
MRHLEVTRKLGVTAPHRRALIRSLALALLERETIQTTRSRAKAMKPLADRMVTLAKRGDLHSRRQLFKMLGSTQTQHPGENRVRLAVENLYKTLAPRFKDRQGGYTRILLLAPRRVGDYAERCLLQYLPPPEDKKEKRQAEADKGKGRKKPAKEAKAAKAPKKEKEEDKPSKQAKATKEKDK